MAGAKKHVMICLAMTFGIGMSKPKQCRVVQKGDTNCEPGVFFPVNGDSAAPVTKGAVAPYGGVWCPECAIVQKMGEVAPSAGTFWAEPSSDALDVKKGDTSPSPGLFCPTGKVCDYVEGGTKASTYGVFFSFNTAAAVAVSTTGETATEGGLWCQKCLMTTKGDVAPEVGRWYDGKNEDGVAVKKDAVAPGGGLFCPDSASGTCGKVRGQVGGSVHGARPTFAAIASLSFAASVVFLFQGL